MYCPSCGTEAIEGFKYCKRCGASVSGTEIQPPSRRLPIVLTIAFLLLIGSIFSVGIALPLAASGDLIRGGFSPSDVMSLLLADIIATVVVIGLLVWAFLRFTRVHAAIPQGAGTSEISRTESARRQVTAPPESISSVTENTTRTLEGTRYETPRSL